MQCFPTLCIELCVITKEKGQEKLTERHQAKKTKQKHLLPKYHFENFYVDILKSYTLHNKIFLDPAGLQHDIVLLLFLAKNTFFGLRSCALEKFIFAICLWLAMSTNSSHKCNQYSLTNEKYTFLNTCIET